MFDFLKKNKEGKKEIKIEYSSNPIALNLSKEESLGILNLRKDTLNGVVNENNLNGMRSKVALVLDFSGSMERMFNDGTVQALIERIIPIALKFDDNGELDFWIFENGFNRLNSITMNNFHGLAKEIKDNYRMGGTNYSPVMNDVIKKYTVEEKSEVPAYVIFITDGDNFDKHQTTKIIKDTCMENVFWQFVGIGNGSMDYLEKLDDMHGRKRDSVDFFRVERVNYITDESLYKKLLDEYPNWIKSI